MATEILVFVPGVLGSELWDGGEKIWPGSLFEALNGFSNAKFNTLMKPSLEARDIVRKAAGGFVGVYNTWIRAFEAIERNQSRLFAERPPIGPQTLYPFPYDWRIDLRTVTDRFAAFLEDILKKTPDADLKLVCHSLGGLIARYYLESGKFNGKPAFAKISLLATLGTPHNGAPIAFAGATGLHQTSFLSEDQSTTLANDPRYPALFQIFPDPTHPFIWAKDTANALKVHTVDQVAPSFGLNTSNIKAWKDFRAGLTGKAPNGVRYFYFVGTRYQTLVRLLWDGNKALEKIELDDAGDGTVSLPGAMDPTIQTEFAGKSHVDLIETREVRVTLAALFRAVTVLSAKELAPHLTVSVRDRMVSTKDRVHVLVEFLPEITRFEGDLTWQRAKDDSPPDAPVFQDVTVIPARQIQLAGPDIGYVVLKAGPVPYSGIYRAVITAKGDPNPNYGPAFVVQQQTPKN